jgi:hypothetical protein
MRLHLVLSCLATLAVAPACTAWHPVYVPPPAAGEEVRIPHLRVTERGAGAGAVELHDARLTADSLVGLRPGVRGEEGRIAIETERVRKLERPRFSLERTFVVAVVALLLLREYAEGVIDGAL